MNFNRIKRPLRTFLLSCLVLAMTASLVPMSRAYAEESVPETSVTETTAPAESSAEESSPEGSSPEETSPAESTEESPSGSETSAPEETTAPAIQETETSAEAPAEPVVKAGFINKAVKLRKTPSSSGKKVVTLSANDQVTIVSCQGIFYKVKAVHKKKKYTGYVQKKYVTLTSGTTDDEPKKVIYLTYDDGPSAYTDYLLKVLEDGGVKATFFVTGGKNKAENIKKVYEAGHTIGVHSMTHDWKIYKSEEKFYTDLQLMSDFIYDAIGYRPDIMRFPGGSSNKVSKKMKKKIMTMLVQSIGEHGYQYFDWNVDSGDAKGTGKTRKKVYKNVVSRCESKDECIILMHDRNKHSIDATIDIINWGKENGYTFDVLTKDGFTYHHKVNN